MEVDEIAKAGLTGDWKRGLKALDVVSANIARETERATKRNAIEAVAAVKQFIRRQDPTWPPLKPSTLRRKRPKTKKLIDKGDLIGSNTFRMIDRWRAFVGVLKQAKGRNGQSMVNVARVHEFGYRGTTGRMITGSKRAGSKIGMKLVIPPRPFLFPTLQRIAPKLAKNWREAVVRAVKKA